MTSRLFFFTSLTIILLSCIRNTDDRDSSTTLSDSLLTDSLEKISVVDTLQLKLEAFNKDSALKHASFAYLIYDIADDTIVAEKNPDVSLVPASSIKLFTSAAALELLGPDTRFRTRLIYNGNIANHVLKGNLIIKGGGDPTFCFGEQTMNNIFAAWVNKLSALQVDSVDGYIIGDGSYFEADNIPYTWTWGEINLGYSAAPSGLSINGNLFTFTFDPSRKGWVGSYPGKMTPDDPTSQFLNRVVVYDGDEEIYIIGSPHQEKKMIRGTTKKGVTRKEVIGVIHDPAFVAATEFRNKLIEKGIPVSGTALDMHNLDSIHLPDSVKTSHEIATLWSPTVNSFVFNVNNHSNNFFAETLIKQLGIKMYHYGSTEAGIKAVYAFLKSKNIDVSGFYMFDGSGISRYNAVTVKQLVSLLRYMLSSPAAESFRASLAVSGVSGTLTNFCSDPGIAGTISGKSGTMSRVKSYAGYATSKNGHPLIFAIIVNNFTCSTLEMRCKIEEVLSHL